MIRCLGISLALGALFLFTPDSPTSNATMQPASVAKIMAEKLKASQVLLDDWPWETSPRSVGVQKSSSS
jgi:hypothetical protein